MNTKSPVTVWAYRQPNFAKPCPGFNHRTQLRVAQYCNSVKAAFSWVEKQRKDVLNRSTQFVFLPTAR